MIQPNLYPLYFSHNFSTDLIKEAVGRYRTHPLGESSVKMECLQTVQIKGCGLTVLESDLFFPNILPSWSSFKRIKKKGSLYKDANIP